MKKLIRTLHNMPAADVGRKYYRANIHALIIFRELHSVTSAYRLAYQSYK